MTFGSKLTPQSRHQVKSFTKEQPQRNRQTLDLARAWDKKAVMEDNIIMRRETQINLEVMCQTTIFHQQGKVQNKVITEEVVHWEIPARADETFIHM